MSQVQHSIAHYYHQRTKYAPETIAAKNQGLDWSKQPEVFKEYKIGTVFDLKSYLNQESDLTQAPENINWLRLSLLLLCSYGITAQLATMYGEPMYLRAAPSAGGLYPAELYLISRGTSWLAPGLYNYQAKSHSLVHFWEKEVWSELQSACFDYPALKTAEIALVTTAIFYRSAWRYQDRAYRRIFLDTGHLLGNIELTAVMNNYRPYLIGGFQDRAMNELLYLDSDREGVISVISLVDLFANQLPESFGQKALASSIDSDYPELPDGQLLDYFHQATQIESLSAVTSINSEKNESLEDKYNFPFCSKVSMKTTTVIDWGEHLSELENTLLKRRSTRAYTGGDLTIDELKSILNFTYQSQDYLEQGLDGAPDYFDLNLIETFIAVSGVAGLEEGCYYYAPKAQQLRQIRFKNFRNELHFLCLGQNLGRDAAAVIFHTADLNQAVAKYGDRAYRYLHMDAGHLGQRINLAAIRLDVGVSGIGGFFDDRVNQVLGIPVEEAVIYLTTLGRPRTR
jgi:SagB-type dehydrogenase family enzyme